MWLDVELECRNGDSTISLTPQTHKFHNAPPNFSEIEQFAAELCRFKFFQTLAPPSDILSLIGNGCEQCRCLRGPVHQRIKFQHSLAMSSWYNNDLANFP